MHSQAPQEPPPPRPIKAPFGWRVHPAALALAIAATIFALVAGGLLVLSLWFMVFGFPVMLAALVTGFSLLRFRSPGAPRPSVFVYVLGFVEVGVAASLLLLAGSSTDSVVIAGYASVPGVVTLLIGFLVDASTSEVTAPPPGYRPSWEAESFAGRNR